MGLPHAVVSHGQPKADPWKDAPTEPLSLCYHEPREVVGICVVHLAERS